MRALTRRADLMDVRIFATTVSVHRDSGGNLPVTLERLSEVIRDRMTYHRQLRSVTASGRFSALLILAAGPILFLYMFFFQPQYGAALVNDSIGRDAGRVGSERAYRIALGLATHQIDLLNVHSASRNIPLFESISAHELAKLARKAEGIRQPGKRSGSLIAAGTFVAITAVLYLVGKFILGIGRNKLPESEMIGSKRPLVLGRLTDAFAFMIPVSKEKEEKLRRELMQAGYYHRKALEEYLAVRNFAMVAWLVLVGIGVVALAEPTENLTPKILLGGFIIAVLVYGLPALCSVRRPPRGRNAFSTHCPTRWT